MPDAAPNAHLALERDLRAALRSGPRTAALADAPLTVQPGGLSNHAWIADRAGDKYFLRLSPADAARLGVDRASECLLLQAVARAGLAPEVVRCDPARRLLVTRHIAGHALARDEAISIRNLERVGHALRRLHALPIPAGVLRVDFAAQAANLEPQGHDAVRPGDELRSDARDVFSALARAGRRDTVCHNDLHHLNLVEGGDHLWLVDWEYGGVGDPAFDLASFLCQHDCGPREQAALLRSYGDGFAPGQLQAACWAFDYVQWLWYRAWPAGEDADTVYAARSLALEQRLRTSRP